MDRIAEFIQKLATVFHVEAKSWDWVASCIALVSILIAIISIVIAVMTLISQRQTEKNTLPIITDDIQKFLFNGMIVPIFDGYVRLSALKNILEELAYASYPSEEMLLNLKIDTSDIHIDMFYKNVSDYWKVQGFLKLLNKYNLQLDTINTHLKDRSIPADFLRTSIEDIISQNLIIAYTWRLVNSLIYKNNNDYPDIDSQISVVDVSKEDEVIPVFYDMDNEYLNLYGTIEEKEKLLHDMNIYTFALTKKLKIKMIPKC